MKSKDIIKNILVAALLTFATSAAAVPIKPPVYPPVRTGPVRPPVYPPIRERPHLSQDRTWKCVAFPYYNRLWCVAR